ncbi:MAG: hypothetical protein HY898_19600 [Deltaproteobacteria bacterium]|nr:hypothetical protein [Deltaproteobacteria bacterium]
MRHVAPFTLALVALLASARADAAPNAASRFVLDIPPLESVASPQAARDVLVKHAAIPSHVELSDARVARAGTLTIYRFRQMRMGLPVIGHGAAIAVQPSGAVALATSRLEPRLPATTTATIDSIHAASVASKASGLPTQPHHARLVIWPGASGGRLAYMVRGPSLLPFPYVPVVIVDALTGNVIARENAVRFKNQAKMNEFNPVSSPTTIDVTLPIPDPNVTPDNPDTVSFNCVDTKTLKPVSYGGFNLNVHVCELASKSSAADAGAGAGEAFAAADGDYLQYQKVDDTSGGDPYAQLSIFYHANQAYTYFRGFDPTFKLSDANKAWPLHLVANLMLPGGSMSQDFAKMQDPNAPLDPFSNAFYTGWDPNGYDQILSTIWPEIKGAALMFGQGPSIDFSYDGDVVFHEFGHAVVDSTAALSGFWHFDSQGGSVSPGGMNEGIADYFSSAIAGEGNSGEYACRDFLGPTCKGIRLLDNDKTCPLWLTGEVHADAEFFSAAMWSVRQTFTTPEDKKAFDQALFATLHTVASGDLGYEDLADAFVKAIESSALGKTAADKMTTEFTDRGILPRCHRMFAWEGTAISSKDKGPGLLGNFMVAGKSEFLMGSALEYAPGLFQVKVPIPANTTTVNATFMELKTSGNPLGGTGTPFTPAFLVSFDKEIEFAIPDKTANTTTVINATASGAKWTAPIPVPAGAKEAYVMLVNKGDNGSMFNSFKFDFVVDMDAGPDASPEVDSGPGPEDAGADASETPPAETPSDDGGCGCRTPASGTLPAGAGIAFLALASILLARRRR